MATLTRYSDFKSLKHSTILKAKNASNANTQQLQEIENFLTLLKKKKRKSK
jgi:hypothetical protein